MPVIRLEGLRLYDLRLYGRDLFNPFSNPFNTFSAGE